MNPSQPSGQLPITPRTVLTNCFGPGGRYNDDVRAREAVFVRALDLAPPVLALSFHACWLHHAANELTRGDEDGPFVAIVRLFADDPGRFAP